MPKQGKNLTDLRASNQGALLKRLLTGGPAAKQRLAEELSLTPMSISYITADLLEKGYLCELPAEALPTPGRRAAKLALVPEQLLAVSVSVSRRSLRASLVDLTGRVLHTVRTAIDSPVTAPQLTETAIRSIEAVLQGRTVLGIGVSCVGLVDIRSGTVVSTTDFHGIADWPIGQLLKQHFALPVVVVEDMKAAALAESYYGVGTAHSDFVYVGITHGIGAAVIAGGKLLEGERGFSGELGHTTLYPQGPRCACGNFGCTELYLSVPTVLKRANAATWSDFTANAASPAMQQFLSDLGTVLTGVVNLFDPAAVVLGHEGALLPSACYEQLQQAVNERTITRRFKTVQVLPSSLAAQITAQSGAAVLFSHLFQGEFKL